MYIRELPYYRSILYSLASKTYCSIGASLTERLQLFMYNITSVGMKLSLLGGSHPLIQCAAAVSLSNSNGDIKMSLSHFPLSLRPSDPVPFIVCTLCVSC